MNFLFPGSLWLLGLAVPVIALYFLRQRQRSLTLPTNFLWVQAVRDTRTAAVWRRFLRSLLLLLQLVALALAVLALAGATAALWSRGSARLVVVVLDRSASMAVADAADGATRMDAAKRAVEAAVDGLRDSDRMMLVAVDDRAEILVPFTPEKGRLRAALRTVSPRDLPTDLTDAAVLLRSQRAATVGRDLEVLVLSDGAFPDPGTLEGVALSFVPFGSATANRGITDVRVVHDTAGTRSLFVSVHAFGAAAGEATVSLRRDGALVAARTVDVPAGAQGVAVFPLDGGARGAHELRIEGEDVFPGDDRVPVILQPEPPRRCAVYGEGSRFLDALLAVRPGLEVVRGPFADGAALEAAGPFDLVVYDGAVPDVLPASRAALFIACVPREGTVRAEGAVELPPVLDWQRTHPVTRHCEFSPLLVTSMLRLTGVPRAGVLVDSPEGPLVALVQQGETEGLYLPFRLADSNLPLLLAAPLFMANAMDRFFSTARPGDEEAVLRTGHPLVRRLPPGAALSVEGPGGIAGHATAGPDGRAAFRDTVRTGLYRWTADSRSGEAAAALLSAGESDITPRTTLRAGDVVHEARPDAVDTNLLLRDPLLLAVLAVLLLEWVIWARRL